MKSNGRRLVGRVTSDKMDKTVVVKVDRVVRHRLYGKVLRRSESYKAHDEQSRARVGDLVRIVECRPLSREKRWMVEAILEPQAVAEADQSPVAASGGEGVGR